MKNIHYPGHQQAVIKNNIVVAVLSFSEHNIDLFKETIKNFECDFFVDLCAIQKDASIGDVWDRRRFNKKPFESWILGEDLQWKPPVEKPDNNNEYIWNESELTWILLENATYFTDDPSL